MELNIEKTKTNKDLPWNVHHFVFARSTGVQGSSSVGYLFLPMKISREIASWGISHLEKMHQSKSRKNATPATPFYEQGKEIMRLFLFPLRWILSITRTDFFLVCSLSTKSFEKMLTPVMLLGCLKMLHAILLGKYNTFFLLDM